MSAKEEGKEKKDRMREKKRIKKNKKRGRKEKGKKERNIEIENIFQKQYSIAISFLPNMQIIC